MAISAVDSAVRTLNVVLTRYANNVIDWADNVTRDVINVTCDAGNVTRVTLRPRAPDQQRASAWRDAHCLTRSVCVSRVCRRGGGDDEALTQ
eukprot:2175925-Rhodomonas_salina.1